MTEHPSLTVSRAARRHGVSPSAITRWIVEGALLRSGQRLKLRAIRLPGGYRTTALWLDQFISILTEDRTRAPAPSELVEERAEQSIANLKAEGW
jgi:hypothetical protein